ncbi:MAG: hypothetical protein BWY64_02838 [bacterium ADurb.Bin363]|nr:MAG: hypothetical protein BWY64_02838 [bacterium ADurb.Bin363]
MGSKDIIKTVDTFTNLSESQKMRLALKQNTTVELLGFLRGYTEQLNGFKGLKDLVSEKLMNKIESDGDDVPYTVLVKTLEIASKAETDAATPVLKIIESMVKAEKEKEESDVPQAPTGTPITKEQMDTAKGLLEVLNQLQKGEFPEKK